MNSVQGRKVYYEDKEYNLLEEGTTYYKFTDGGKPLIVSKEYFYSAPETFSGDYNDLINTPTIPSDISDLTDTTEELRGVRSFVIDEGDPIPTDAQSGDIIFEKPV